MKITADVIGVEQAMDFNTLEQSAFVVIDILGARVRVPITEEQMEAITITAIQEKKAREEEGDVRKADDTFEETKEASATPPRHREQVEVQERDFSVMAELTSHGTGEEAAENDVLDLFSPSSEEEAKIAQLRSRAPLIGSAREAPSPPVSHGLPQMPGFGTAGDDDGIQQG